MMSNFRLRKAFFLAIATLCLYASGFGQTAVQTELAGGRGGNPFQDITMPSDGRISEVRIASGNFVDSVQLIFTLTDNRIVTGPLRGGTGGQVSTFRLAYDEYIVGLSGRYGENMDSLRIHTNKRTSPLYGGTGGRQDYNIQIPIGNQAVGFIGRSGKYVDAIGLAYTPAYLQMAGQTNIAGGSGGSAFADRAIPLGANLIEIRVHVGKYIDGIQAVYSLPNGSLFEGPYHGGGGGSTNIFKLESNEYVIGISGRSGEYIDSLRIHTNRRTSSLFGGAGGRQEYRIDVPSGNRAVGLIGRSGRYLDAIGLSYTAGRQTRDFFRRRDDR